MRMRKAVASGLTALLATAALAGCGDAPESSASGGDGGEETPAASDFLPCIVSDAGGFDDKSFNQLGFEGAKQAADELGVELNAVESNSENDYAPEPREPRRRGLRRHRDRGLRPGGRDQGVGRRQPRHRLHPHRRRCRRRRRRRDLRRPGRRAQHQAAALRHRPGGVPGRLPRRRLHQDRCRRHLRRPAVPDRDDLHGRLQAGRRVLRQGEGQGRQGRRLGRQGQGLVHRWLRGQRDGHQHRSPAPRPGRRRDPAGRWPDLPGRADRDRRLRQRTSR